MSDRDLERFRLAVRFLGLFSAWLQSDDGLMLSEVASDVEVREIVCKASDFMMAIFWEYREGLRLLP